MTHKSGKSCLYSLLKLRNIAKSQGELKLMCFRLVVGAAIVHIVNILFIYFGTREARAKAATIPVLEEKGNGAIMLYWQLAITIISCTYVL